MFAHNYIKQNIITDVTDNFLTVSLSLHVTVSELQGSKSTTPSSYTVLYKTLLHTLMCRVLVFCLTCFSLSLFPSDSALWSSDVFSALCHVVTSCKNFKVRIRSAAALAVPARRECYGDTNRFSCVWHSLATALENSEDTNDFLEYRYSASLRHTLSQALLHLLSISQSQDMPFLAASLAGEEGRSIRQHLIKYLKSVEAGGEGGGVEGEKDTVGNHMNPQHRIESLLLTLNRLKVLKPEEEGKEREERAKGEVVEFFEDLMKTCEEL